MDPVRFDGLTRMLSQARSRRGVVALLSALPLARALTTLGKDEAAAEQPRNRLKRRTGQRNRKRRNRKQHNKKNNQKQNGGGLRPGACGATGSVCTQNSDCCTNNCFGFECAELVTSCGQGSAATRCQPPANGCGGNQCCHGSLACGDTCCQGAANQCNPQNACCVPNCAGRQCGDDGCGNGETCGTCATGQTCDAETGTCKGGACSAQNCPNGCCDTAGTCHPGNTNSACGVGGVACETCPSPGTACLTGHCTTLATYIACLCNDNQWPAYCGAAVCDQNTITSICTGLCQNHVGWSLQHLATCHLHACHA